MKALESVRKKMRILKECQICWQEIGKNICRNCGRGICDTHFDQQKQVCASCSKGPFVQV